MGGLKHQIGELGKCGKSPHERTALDRQTSATDARPDHLVYDLYGLTEEEIKPVEGT